MKKLSKFLSLFFGLLTIGITTGVAYGATSFSNVKEADAAGPSATEYVAGTWTDWANQKQPMVWGGDKFYYFLNTTSWDSTSGNEFKTIVGSNWYPGSNVSIGSNKEVKMISSDKNPSVSDKGTNPSTFTNSKTYYFYTGDFTKWEEGNAKFGVMFVGDQTNHAFVSATKISSFRGDTNTSNIHYFSFTVPSTGTYYYASIGRLSDTSNITSSSSVEDYNSAIWDAGLVSPNTTHNVYKITGYSAQIEKGDWSLRKITYQFASGSTGQMKFLPKYSDGGTYNEDGTEITLNSGSTYNDYVTNNDQINGNGYTSTVTGTVFDKIMVSGDTTTKFGEKFNYNNPSKDLTFTVYSNELPRFTVTFDVQGIGTAPSSQTVYKGEKLTKPTDPTALGYTFGGWYKEAACTNAWNFSTDTVTTTMTLYAKWTKETVQHRVTLNCGSHGSGSYYRDINEDSYFTFPTFPDSGMSVDLGYAFKEWNSSIDGEGTTYDPGDTYQVKAPVTFYAVYQVKYYGMAGSTRFDLTYDAQTNKFSANKVWFNKGDGLKLINAATGEIEYAGIDNDSVGIWKDPEGLSPRKVTCDEDNATQFNLSIPNNDGAKFWLMTYTDDPGTIYSVYIGDQRVSMTPCAVTPEQEAEGMFEQFEAQVSGVSRGDSISFQSNHTQTGKITYSRDRNSNQYVEPTTQTLDGIRISGNVHVYLKHYKKTEQGQEVTYWTTFITGLSGSTDYSLVIDNPDGKTSRTKDLTFNKDIAWEQTEWKAIDFQINAGESVSGYSKVGDGYFNFNGIEDSSPAKNNFDLVNGNLVCKEGCSGSYNIYVKLYGVDNNWVYIDFGSPDYEGEARDFAVRFKEAIVINCNNGQPNVDDLQDTWDAFSTEYDEELSDGAKALLTKDSEITEVQDMYVSYNIAYTRHAAELQAHGGDFLNYYSVEANQMLLKESHSYSLSENEDQTVLIVVIAASATLLATTSALLLLKKKKKAK